MWGRMGVGQSPAMRDMWCLSPSPQSSSTDQLVPLSRFAGTEHEGRPIKQRLIRFNVCALATTTNVVSDCARQVTVDGRISLRERQEKLKCFACHLGGSLMAIER